MSFSTILLILHYTIFCNTAIQCPDPNAAGECSRCTSNMDPHITTFDNMYYDNHIPLCYKYVTGCPNNPNYIPFEIIGCHYYCFSSYPYTCVGDISVVFFNESGTKTFDINIALTSTSAATDALTNGTLVNDVPYTFDTIQNHQFKYLYNTPNTHRFNIYSATSPSFYAYITYYPGSLEIFLSHSYFPNKVCGLCGLFDNDHTNELLGSDGTQYLPANITNISKTDGSRVLLLRSANPIINDFSSTYVYGPNNPPNNTFIFLPSEVGIPSIRRLIRTTSNYFTTTSVEPRRLQPVDPETACRNLVRPCCDEVWTEATTTWLNPIDNQATAKFDWIEGCIRDVCLLSNDGYTLPCDTTDWEFNIAKNQAVATAANTYPILTVTTDAPGATDPPVTTTDAPVTTTDAPPKSKGKKPKSKGKKPKSKGKKPGKGKGNPKGKGKGKGNPKGKGKGKGKGYGRRLVGNNNDDMYTIDIFSNSFWYVMVSVMLVVNIVFWMYCVYKRNDNTTNEYIESDSDDINQSNIDKI